MLGKRVITSNIIQILGLILLLISCGNDEESIPDYQEAIYIMDSDGSNKQKVIDVDECYNVQFIPNSNKLLYLSGNSLYTVNIGGTDIEKISGNLNITDHLPAVNELGSKLSFMYKYFSSTNVGLINLEDCSMNYLSNSNRNESFPNFSTSQEFLTFAIFNNIKECYEIKKIDLTNYEEKTIYSNFKSNPISETYLNDISNELFFSEAQYRGNASLFVVNLDNDQISTLSGNLSIGHGNQTCFNLNFIAYPSYPNVGIYNFLNGSNTFFEQGYWPDINQGKLLLNKSFHLDWESSIQIIDLELDNGIVLEIKHSYEGKYSQGGKKICLIGQYIKNPPQKNRITN